MNISFAGCGFLGIYHVGVASCFRKHAPNLIDKICGASAGALVGILLACDDIDLGKITDDVLKTAAKARARSLGPFHPGFNIHQILIDGMRRILPEDVHERASGRLYISLTRVSDRKNVIVSEYRSKEDLMEALLCSAFIPFYSGFLPPSFRGTRYVDGGISDNLPIIDKTCKTITVSPFSGAAEICPKSDEFSDYLDFTISNTHIQVTPSNLYRMCRALYPPEPSVLSRMCKQGFEDALVYLKKHTLISCERHIPRGRSKSTWSLPSKDSSSSFLQAPGISRRHSTSDLRTSSSSWRRKSSSQTSSNQTLSEEELEEEDEEEVDCMDEAVRDDDEIDGDATMWEDWHDDDFFEDRTCEKCEERSQKLHLVKSMPPEVMEVLQAACQSVRHSGIWSYITQGKLGQAISLASLPCVLPLETAFSIAMRFTRWLPYLPSDLQWFVSCLSSILQVVAKRMEEIDGKSFEAQFSCHFGLQLEPEHMSALAGLPATSKCHSHHHGTHHAHELHALDIATGTPGRQKLSFQFSMDVQTETLPDCVVDTFDFCDDVNEFAIPRRRRMNLSSEDSISHHHISNGCECDSFDYTLKVTNEMEDVLTYHYLHVTQQLDRQNGHGSVEIVEL